MNRMPIDARPDQLRHADWNPRRNITPGSVADLTASIRELGLVQRVTVIEDPDGARLPDGRARYVVVAGNRRLAACREAGLDPVPCELLDVDEATAKRMTIIENLQRADADPVMEAELIKGLTDAGLTVAQIAAETGRGEKWVWRRRQLADLSEGWRALAEDGGFTLSVDCLERIARYPADVQAAALAEAKKDCVRWWAGIVRWNSVSNLFARRVRRIADAPFPKTACAGCPHNSANAPMLFDVDGSGRAAKFGDCLRAACYDGKVDDLAGKAVAAAKRKGLKVVAMDYRCEVPGDVRTRPDAKHTVLYTWGEGGTTRFAYAEPQKKADTRTEAEKERDRAGKERVKMKKAALDFLMEWAGDGRVEALVRDLVGEQGGVVTDLAGLFTLCAALEVPHYCVGNLLRSLAVRRCADRFARRECADRPKWEEVWDALDHYAEPKSRDEAMTLFGLVRELVRKDMPAEQFAVLDAAWREESRHAGPWFGDGDGAEADSGI